MSLLTPNSPLVIASIQPVKVLYDVINMDDTKTIFFK